MAAKTQDAAGETGDEHTATCRANKAGTLHYLGERAPCICQPSAWRRKPVVLAALEWTGHNLREVIAFTGRHESARDWTWEHFEDVVRREGLKIFTLEGPHHAAVGDFIVRGVKGEFWPVKPDIFAATYEPAQSPATPRETAIAAPTGETLTNTLKEKWALRKAADFDRILDVLPKGPRCRDCADSDGRCMNEAEPRPPCDPVEHVIELLRSALAARVPAPSAPQDPRGESDEGMRAEAHLRVMYENLLHMCAISDAFRRSQLREFDALLAALSPEARDAD